MTNTPPPEPPQDRNFLSQVRNFFTRPSTLVAGGVLLTLGAAGYAGINYFVYKSLSPLLEKQLSQFLKREVELGEIESFSLNYIRFGPSIIPATANDPDNLSVKAIAIGFNPLPLLLGQPLALDVNIDRPNLYLEQAKNGKCIDIELPEPQKDRELPIDLNVNVRLTEADLALLPYRFPRPVTLQVDGTGGYTYKSRKDQQIRYDIAATVLDSQVDLAGKTNFENGQTQADISINRLSLPELVALFPNLPVTLKQGIVDSDFTLSIPSFDNIEASRGQGSLDLIGLEGTVKTLKKPLKVNVNLDFEGKTVQVRQAQINLGDATTQIAGVIDWEKGYNLAIDVRSLPIKTILDLLRIKTTAQFAGNVQGNFKLGGAVTEPILTGNLQNSTPLVIAKIPFKTFKANLIADANRLTVKQTQILPAAGGQIFAQAKLDFGIGRAIEQEKNIDWQKMPLSLNFQARDLPSQPIASPYYQPPSPARLGKLSANGQVRGTLAKLVTTAKWSSPDLISVPKQTVAAQGDIVWSGQTIVLQNTRLRTNGGSALVSGVADFKRDQWKANLAADSFIITPFLPVVCSFATCPPRLYAQSVSLNEAQIRIGGKVTNISLSNLETQANFRLAVDNGSIAVRGNLNRGNANATVVATGLDIEPYLPANLTVPVSLGRTKVTLSGNVAQLTEGSRFNADRLNVDLEAQLTVDGSPVNASGQLRNGIINAFARTGQISLNRFAPNLPFPTRLNAARLNLRGNLDALLDSWGETPNFNSFQGNADLDLAVQGNPVDVTGTLRNGTVNAVANLGSIPLEGLLPNLNVPARLVAGKVNVSSPLASLLAETPDFSNTVASANLQLATNSGDRISANGSLRNGVLNAVANLGTLSLNELFPNFKIPARLTGGNITASSPLAPLLAETPDLSNAQVTANLRLAAAQGTINTLTRLNGYQWRSSITANNLNPGLIVDRLSTQLQRLDLNQLDAQLQLAGNLRNLFDPNATLPIQAQAIALQADGQSVKAKGNILVSDLFSAPDIASVNLDVTARSNLNNLPLTQLIAVSPQRRRFFPEELKLAGSGQFQGRFTGRNLLSTPGNLNLTGDLTLRNFAFNDRKFEPLLRGSVRVTPREEIAVNLQGREDRISAVLDPCTRSECPAPYLPVSATLRQTYGSEQPLIAQIQRTGDRLIASVERLSLDLFKIALGREYGIPGYLSGEVTTRLDVNPYTLQGSGSLSIKEPSLGFIEAQQINADFSYADGLARLQAATLQLGTSLYEVAGSFNFKTKAIQANLAVNQGRVQDLFTAIKITEIERLTALLRRKPADYETAKQIPPQSVGNANGPLADQVNLLAIIDRQIRNLARLREGGVVPTELDIRGIFNAEVALAGTLSDPNLNFQLSGQQWEWRPQTSFPDIVEPLGLVIKDTQLIPINRVLLQGAYADNTLQIQNAQLQIKETQLALQGRFSPQQIAANWTVEDLSLDTINTFVRIPLDTSGNFDAAGTFGGSFSDPQIAGQFAVADAAIRGRAIEQTVQGSFQYVDARLNLVTAEPSVVDATASIPFPIRPDNNQFAIDVRLNEEALGLVGALTQEQLSFVGGEGNVALQAQGRIELAKGLRLYDLTVNGVVNLNEAVFASSALPEPLIVSGQILADDRVLQVPQLQGRFAESQLAVSGVLPLFEAQPSLDNPLTAVINKGKFTLEGLYEGEIDGRVVVTGTALAPIVGGQVLLANGQIFVPERTQSNEALPAALSRLTRTTPTVARRGGTRPFIPTLDDFQVNLQGLFIEQLPFYQFNFGGQLTLDGPLANLSAIRPNGVITLNRGIVNFLETRFLLERRNQNVIVFTPEQGLLNPKLDLQMRTIVSELPISKRYRAAETTEIPDDSITKVQRVDINLSINGSLNQLLPGIGKNEAEVCRIRDAFVPIQAEAAITQTDLQQLTTCLNVLAAKGGADEQLLSNQAIRLTSSPPRSQGQIIRLLGEQILVLAESLQGKNTEQLLQVGIVQLALPMVFQGVLYDVESTISEAIGSTDFRIVPYLETIYQVEKEGYIRVSYDYSFNEFRVQYEKRF